MVDWEKYKKEKETMTREDKITFLRSIIEDKTEPCIVREAAGIKLLEFL